MAIEYIGVGTYPNDTTGDPLQLAFTKCNDNFYFLNSLANNSATVNLPNQCTATLSAGAQDFGASPPAGYVQYVSNQLIFTANAAGSTLNGLLYGYNGFTAMIYNPGSGGLIFGHRAAGNSLNQFNCAGGVSAYLGPFGAALISYINGTGWVFL